MKEHSKITDSTSGFDSANIRIDVHEIIDGYPVSSNWNDFLTHRNDTKRLFRVNIFAREPASLNNIMNAIHKNPLVVERCLDPDSVSGVYIYSDMLSLQLPIEEDWQASVHSKLSIFCFSNALITICINAQTEYPDSLLNNSASISNRPPGTEDLLFSLLDSIVDRSSELTLKARLSVEQLETDMQQIVDEEQLGRHILALKRAAAHFEMALEAKHRTLMALLSIDTRLIDLPRIREPLHDVVAHVEHSLRYIERVEDHLGELDRHFLLLLQDRTNNRLRLLTIISAIYMPLTLLAGIYGMNFHFMPELSWRYGYGAVLLTMLSLALGLIWYFYRKGWFR